MLAEVWKTNYGVLFISRLPGAAFDPGDDPNDSFAPPTAVLPESGRVNRPARRLSAGGLREPVPVTIVRILLDRLDMASASLWVKCANHVAVEVDRVKLYKVYELDQEGRRHHDTPVPTVVRLHDVVALSSDLY